FGGVHAHDNEEARSLFIADAVDLENAQSNMQVPVIIMLTDSTVFHVALINTTETPWSIGITPAIRGLAGIAYSKLEENVKADINQIKNVISSRIFSVPNFADLTSSG